MAKGTLKFSRDPLLAAGQVLLALVMGFAILLIVLAALGAGAVVTVQRAEIAARIADAGLTGVISVWSIFGGLLAFCLAMALAFRFTMELDRIIKSLDAGDPFVPENADRLGRMAWLALAFQVIVAALTFGQTYLERLFGEGDPPSNLTASFVGSAALVLTLFILARVFRHGAKMREELEGTV